MNMNSSCKCKDYFLMQHIYILTIKCSVLKFTKQFTKLVILQFIYTQPVKSFRTAQFFQLFIAIQVVQVQSTS